MSKLRTHTHRVIKKWGGRGEREKGCVCTQEIVGHGYVISAFGRWRQKEFKIILGLSPRLW